MLYARGGGGLRHTLSYFEQKHFFEKWCKVPKDVFLLDLGSAGVMVVMMMMMSWNLNVSISCEKGACTVVTLPSLVAYGVHGLNLRPTAQHLAQTILSFCGILVTWQTAHYHISFQKFSSVSLRHLLARGNFLICLTDPERTPLEIEIEIHCPIPNTISCSVQWYNGWST